MSVTGVVEDDLLVLVGHARAKGREDTAAIAAAALARIESDAARHARMVDAVDDALEFLTDAQLRLRREGGVDAQALIDRMRDVLGRVRKEGT